MRYLSTRGDPGRPGFVGILFDGLAPDGGLYVPEQWLAPGNRPTLDYAGLTAAVLAPYVAPDPLEPDIPALVAEAYAAFRHPDVAPLTEVGDDRYLLELFWGPTLSFKDYALSVLGGLFERLLQGSRRRIVVLGATSGDTGSAAIEACRGRDNIDVVILYPEGRITEVQRRQMTTVPEENVVAVSIAGTFDDCQALVKQAFADIQLGVDLVAVNSINWARIAVQAAYYLSAAERIGDERLAFAIPTGNFGNALAGYVAQRMGAPIERLIIANNRNHGLSDLITTGTLTVEQPIPTLAPAMDIQIPSNLERYLFELTDGDTNRVRAWQNQLSETRRLSLSASERGRMQQLLVADWLPDDEVIDAMQEAHTTAGMVLDPHTAIAWRIGNRLRPPGASLVTVATAHPAKFAEAVVEATGLTPELPADLADLADRDERKVSLPTDYQALVEFLRSR
jgi:threonine synthase